MMIIIIASENQGKLACIAFERRNFKRSGAYIYFLAKEKPRLYDAAIFILLDCKNNYR